MYLYILMKEKNIIWKNYRDNRDNMEENKYYYTTATGWIKNVSSCISLGGIESEDALNFPVSLSLNQPKPKT